MVSGGLIDFYRVNRSGAADGKEDCTSLSTLYPNSPKILER